MKSLKQEPIKCHEGEGGRNNFQNTNFSVFSLRRAAVVSPQPSPAHVEGQPKIGIKITRKLYLNQDNRPSSVWSLHHPPGAFHQFPSPPGGTWLHGTWLFHFTRKREFCPGGSELPLPASHGVRRPFYLPDSRPRNTRELLFTLNRSAGFDSLPVPSAVWTSISLAGIFQFIHPPAK